MLSEFKIISVPSNFDYVAFVEAMLGADFMLYHDLSTLSTYLICDDASALERLKNVEAGMDFAPANPRIGTRSLTAIVAYAEQQREPHYAQSGKQYAAQKPAQILESLFSILGGHNCGLAVAFVHTDAKYIGALKNKIESELSRHEKRLTQNSGQKTKFGIASSTQRDLYYESDEVMLLESILGMINEAMISGGNAYKVTLIADSAEGDTRLVDYIKSKMYIIDEYKIAASGFEELYAKIARADAIPFSYKRASSIICFPRSIRSVENIGTSAHLSENGEIVIGEYLEKSVSGTGRRVAVNPEVFNLGTIITGLPGTGKTYAAMGMLEQIRNAVNPMLVIIAPTSEWTRFAQANGIAAIKLYESSTKLNFFSCEANINIERFYENLAMLIASASNAGPYKNSLEKVLLAAFRNVYSKLRNPDPIDVYDAIEEAVIEQHAKRTNAGVKYTKHGENVRAALENLRLMLFRPELAVSHGASFHDLFERGVLFDLSNVSNSMKPFFYSLILNQAYSFADAFGIDSEGRLNMAIAAEEAQLVFGADSPATADLVQRIQDFRKKGVGLFLLSHSVTEIDPKIRRMCQTKLYFRQSPDTAKLALADLSFPESESVLERIKGLEQRVCALGYLNAHGSVKEPFESVFVRTLDVAYNGTTLADAPHADAPDETQLCESVIRVIDSANAPVVGLDAELFYVWEKVAHSKTDSEGRIRFSNTIKGKRYRLVLKGEKKKDVRTYDIIGGADSIVAYQ
ncbi:MAG: hypothetical protein QXL63_02900 [Candidatus Micrarchaeaceae archaeon]